MISEKVYAVHLLHTPLGRPLHIVIVMKSKLFSRPSFKMWLGGQSVVSSCSRKKNKTQKLLKIVPLPQIFRWDFLPPSNNSQQYIGYWIKVNNSCQSSSCYTSEGCIQSCALVALRFFFFFLFVCLPCDFT